MASFKKRLVTNLIVVHCSATKGSANTSAADIDRWHRAKGWNGNGYHYVIRRDGTVEVGRPFDAVGAHVEGFNASSVGICMAGGLHELDGKATGGDYTLQQWEALKTLLGSLSKQYPKATICGHRDLSPDTNKNGKVDKSEWLKDCPCFSVKDWWAELVGMMP